MVADRHVKGDAGHHHQDQTHQRLAALECGLPEVQEGCRDSHTARRGAGEAGGPQQETVRNHQRGLHRHRHARRVPPRVQHRPGAQGPRRLAGSARRGHGERCPAHRRALGAWQHGPLGRAFRLPRAAPKAGRCRRRAAGAAPCSSGGGGGGALGPRLAGGGARRRRRLPAATPPLSLFSSAALRGDPEAKPPPPPPPPVPGEGA
mmetsp:Transcript_1250/g.3640  ORF Transcript_1250/g.3640 Transcript_1250/m.3640 type:complete len:205 (+) Transcript_1250:858-1472(+)